MGQLFAFNATGGYALELEAFYLFGALSVVLLGAGRYSVGSRRLN
jgi:putative oxidoreductase